jgi:hypothetical protein
MLRHLAVSSLATTLKKRPRELLRMQLRAMAIARCVLPVPVPPTRTTLRCCTMNPPAARSRTSASLMGVPSNSKSAGHLGAKRVAQHACLRQPGSHLWPGPVPEAAGRSLGPRCGRVMPEPTSGSTRSSSLWPF